MQESRHRHTCLRLRHLPNRGVLHAWKCQEYAHHCRARLWPHQPHDRTVSRKNLRLHSRASLDTHAAARRQPLERFDQPPVRACPVATLSSWNGDDVWRCLPLRQSLVAASALAFLYLRLELQTEMEKVGARQLALPLGRSAACLIVRTERSSAWPAPIAVLSCSAYALSRLLRVGRLSCACCE